MVQPVAWFLCVPTSAEARIERFRCRMVVGVRALSLKTSFLAVARVVA